MSLRFDSRLLEPPSAPVLPPRRQSTRSATSSVLSSLGDLHDDDSSILSHTQPPPSFHHYNHHNEQQQQQQQHVSHVQPQPQLSQQTHPLQRRRSTHNSLRFSSEYAYDNDDLYDNDDNASVVVRGHVPSSDLRNVNTLFSTLGVAGGAALAVALTQLESPLDAPLVQWLLLLPSDLYTNALVCAIIPTIFLNAVLSSLHFAALNKAKALATKTLGLFFLLTLSASVVGAVVALCAAPLVFTHSHALHLAIQSSSNTTRVTMPRDAAALAFQCPLATTQSLMLDADGTLRCVSVNESIQATPFVLHDVAHTFRIQQNHTGSFMDRATAIPTLLELFIQLLESLCPIDVFNAIGRVDVVSVGLVGVALGVALHRFAHRQSVTGTNDSSLLLLLFIQIDVLLSVVLRALLQVLPLALVGLVSRTLLQQPSLDADANAAALPLAQDVVRFVSVLVFALSLHVASVVAFTRVVTKANPLAFVSQLLPAQLVALGTSSSLLTLPVTIRSIAASKHVSMPLAYCVCAAGAALNKTGSALYLAVASVYVVNAAGLEDKVPWTIGRILTLVGVSVLGASVLPPLPQTRGVRSLFVVGSVLSTVLGEDDSDRDTIRKLLVFVAATDWICDPLVTVVNVTTSALVAFVLAHEMDERFRDQSIAIKYEGVGEHDDEGEGETDSSQSSAAQQEVVADMRQQQQQRHY